ncbi:WIBG, Mago-binding [Dillenia turbinata]|uniref:WIBG, Mago-binding n=1 Tax=Dillenia turbinata TaxID=194707 RepID=A0AAN8VTI8_9MAGN
MGSEENQLGLGKTLKEGERILAPTRRPDGTMRKAIRIRAGYVPQDEVAIYQSKGALLRKAMAEPVVPPGYDPVLDAKPKTKSAKRNERRKEKKLQASLDKEKMLESDAVMEIKNPETTSAENRVDEIGAVESVTFQMNRVAISLNSSAVPDSLEAGDDSNSAGPGPDIDKKIRALKKKIRLTEAQLQKIDQAYMKPEQLDKANKLQGWHEDLKLLEDKKAELRAS